MDSNRDECAQQSEIIDIDLLVIGGGIGGMTVAAAAAEQGAVVAVIEVSEEIGGSALISQGYVSTPPSVEAFLVDDPEGDTARFAYMLEHLEETFDWIGGLDVWLSPPIKGVLGYCDGRQLDVAGYFAAARRLVEGAGGFVVRNTATRRLVRCDGAVVGAYCEDIDSGEMVTLRAPATVLATGGFQASDEARRRYLPASAQRFVTRSNPNSRGDGIQLGFDAGGAHSKRMEGFYGHLLPYPLPPLKYSDFARVAFYESPLGVLLARDGKRFCDESHGDHVNVQRVSEIEKAVLVVDDEVRQTGLSLLMPKGDGAEKWALATKMGAHSVQSDSLAGLGQKISEWGYDGDAAIETLESFNRQMEDPSSDPHPPRLRHRRTLSCPPFYAVEVQAGITFTYGGLSNDIHGRVLDDAGRPVPGLFVAGVDAGGFNHTGYAGGLVRGLVFGRMVAKAALEASANTKESA